MDCKALAMGLHSNLPGDLADKEDDLVAEDPVAEDPVADEAITVEADDSVIELNMAF